MKLFKKFSLILLSVMIVLCSTFILVGCDKDDDKAKVYVFAKTGGYVQVDNNQKVYPGDEGSKYFVYKEDAIVKLKAVADEGYRFVKWEYTDDIEDGIERFIYKDEVDLRVEDDAIVIRAVFALEGSINYTITYPTQGTGYNIAIESGYSTNVTLGGEFKFKVNLLSDYSNSDIVVKANDDTLTANTKGIYTISNINRNIEISVEGVKLNDQPQVQTYLIYTLDNRFEITPLNTTGLEVESGSSFRFEITPKAGYVFGSNIIVKAGGVVLQKLSGTGYKYEIYSVTKNMEIIVEGISQQAQIINYVFTLGLESGKEEALQDIWISVPKTIAINVSEELKQNNRYLLSNIEIMVDGGTMTMKEFVDNIKSVLESTGVYDNYEFTALKSGVIDFIVIDGESMEIDWNILNVVDTTYYLTMIIAEKA